MFESCRPHVESVAQLVARESHDLKVEGSTPSILTSPWRNGLARLITNQEVPGSSPGGDCIFHIYLCILTAISILAHLVEHQT